MVALAREYELKQEREWGRSFQGAALAGLGRIARASNSCRTAWRCRRAIGARLVRTAFCALLAEMLAADGRIDEGLRAVDEGFAHADSRSKAATSRSSIACAVSCCEFERGPAAAEASMRDAIARSGQQQTRSFSSAQRRHLAGLRRTHRLGGRGPRRAGAGLWLVHRRLRHARPARGAETLADDRTMTWPRRILSAGLVIAIVIAALAWLSAPDLEAISRTESSDIQAIVSGILTLQARDAATQHRALARGTHAKGICALAEFEVHDLLATVPNRALATRLARGLYAAPAKYSATVRFANADSNLNPDDQHDVRAMSFALEPSATQPRFDFSTNDPTTFPINDAHAFATTVQVVTAPSMGRGVWGLSFMDKLTFARTAVLGYEQEHQQTLPYQRRRYWSTVPFPARAIPTSSSIPPRRARARAISNASTKRARSRR